MSVSEQMRTYPPPLRHEPGPEWCQIREGYVRTRQWLRCWHWWKYEMINDFFSACVTSTVGRYITTYWKLFDTKRSVRKNDTNIHEKFTQWYISTKSVLHVKFFLYIYTKGSKLNFRIYFHHCSKLYEINYFVVKFKFVMLLWWYTMLYYEKILRMFVSLNFDYKKYWSSS